MKNSILYIIGAFVVLGGGAFLFLKNKNLKDAEKLKELEGLQTPKKTDTEKSQNANSSKPTNGTSNSSPVEKTLTADEMIKIDAIAKEIVRLTQLREGYKRASSKAGIQVVIDEKYGQLASYGFTLGIDKQLIKIA